MFFPLPSLETATPLVCKSTWSCFLMKLLAFDWGVPLVPIADDPKPTDGLDLALAVYRCMPIFFWRGWTLVPDCAELPPSPAKAAEPKPLTPIYGCLAEWWAELDPSPALDLDSLRDLLSRFALSFSFCAPSSAVI